MIRKNCLLITICIIMCISFTSCEYSKEIINQGKASKNNSMLKEKKIESNEKYGAYNALDIFITGKLQDSLNYYFEKFGQGEEFIVNKDSDLHTGIFLQFNKNELEEKVKYSCKSPSFHKVDNDVKKLYPKLKLLVDSLSEADSYYKLKSYVDDNFVKGRELHKKIYLQYREVNPLINKFISDFEDVFLIESKKDLEEFKKNDFMIRYYALNIILKSIDLEKELHNQNITYENIQDLNVAKFKEKYDLLMKDTNKFLEYCQDEDRIKKEKLDPTIAYANIFKSKLTDLKAEATNILMRAQQQDDNNNRISKNSFYKRREEGNPENYDNKIKEAICEYVKIK